MGKLFDVSLVFSSIPELLTKLPITLELAVVSMLIGLGLVMAIIKMKKIRVLTQITNLLISLLRGTPVIVQLYVAFFGIPMMFKAINQQFGTNLAVANISGFVYAMIALELNQSGFMAEIIRSALQSVDPGQIEAAHALGMTYPQTLRRIILPEAIEVALPTLGNSFISIIKGTSLAFTCAVVEITAQGQIIAGRTYRYFEVYISLAIIYWLVTLVIEQIIRVIENKIRIPNQVELASAGEELYCKGANAFDYSQVQAKEAYVLDLSGAIGAAAYAAPTLVSFQAEIQGKAAHAGFHPEEGINSIQAAACAIAKLPQGYVAENTTANIGKIGGGSGTNIVSESCRIEGEIRSLNHEKAMELLETYHKTFQQEAEKVQASLVWKEKRNIHAYETPLTSDAAKHYESAVKKEGLTAAFEKTFGGSDNNVFAQHGIEGLVIATSMNQVHSCAEYTKIPEIAQVARILVHLATEE